jgi:hypothetical protein
MVSKRLSSSDRGNQPADNTHTLSVAHMKAWEQGGAPLGPPPSNSFIDNTQGQIERNVTYENLWRELMRSDLESLNNADCIREYSSPLIDRRRHLILVVDEDYNTKTNISSLGLYIAKFKRTSESGECNRDGYDWLCQAAFGDKCHWGDGCSKPEQLILAIGRPLVGVSLYTIFLRRFISPALSALAPTWPGWLFHSMA